MTMKHAGRGCSSPGTKLLCGYESEEEDSEMNQGKA